MAKKKSNEPVIHEIDVFVDGGKCELLMLGGETITLKPLKLSRIKKLISIFGDSLPIANKNVDKFLPEGFKPTGVEEADNLVYSQAAKQSQLQAFMSETILDEVVDFLCMVIEKPKDWVEDNIKPSGIFQILEIMVKQNDLEEHIPFLQGAEDKK